MSSTYVITLDGVLRDPLTQAVRPQGVTLYAALAGTGRLAILCGEDPGMAQYFLAANGMTKHAYLIPEDPMRSPRVDERRVHQVHALRGQGCHIEFVVDHDPSVVAALFDAGIPTMLYLHPHFTSPSFRPDYEANAKPWNDLVQRVDYQEQMRAKTALMSRDDDE